MTTLFSRAAALFLLLAATGIAQAEWQVASTKRKASPDESVEHWTTVVENAETASRATLHFAAFETRAATIRVIDQPEAPRKDLAEVMTRTKAVAGVNGGYFDPEDAPLGLLVSDGRVLSPFRKAKLLTGVLFATKSRVDIVRATRFSMNGTIKSAVQCGPFLVERAAPVAGLDDTRPARRTFAAVDGDGRAALGICSAISLAELSRILCLTNLAGKTRIVRALNLDGGSSSAFWFSGDEPSSIREAKSVRDFVAVVTPLKDAGAAAPSSLSLPASIRQNLCNLWRLMRTFGGFIDHGSRVYGEVRGEDVHLLAQPFWLGLQFNGEVRSLGKLVVGLPVAPSKVIAVGLNYREHIEEMQRTEIGSPLIWFKAPSSLLPHLGTIEIAFPEHKTDFETELAVVIGTAAKNVSVERALDHVFGYTIAEDISDRDLQKSEKQFGRAKSFDTYTPVGPFVYAGIDPHDLEISLSQNGEVKQRARTGQMIYSVAEIVAFASQSLTLLPGDLILTGTPSGVGPIRAGDELVATVGEWPALRNRVEQADKK